MADSNKINEIYEAAQAIENEFDSEFMDLLEVFHEWDRIPEEDHDSDIPQYRVIAVVDAVDGELEGGEPYGSVFTGPLCDFGREHGLYVYDHVVRIGYEAEEPITHDAEYTTDARIEVRFGLEEE